MKKKNLIPNSVRTRPGQENSQKNIKKSRKIIKPLPGNFFSQNGMRYEEKERKKILVPNSVHTRPGQENFKKYIKKIQKIIKPFPAIIFS